MKYAEALPGLLILALRLALVPPAAWAKDWIAVLALLWIAVALTHEDTAPRRWSAGLACFWLTVIYGLNQLPWTVAGWS